MAGKNQHVVPTPNGKWGVRGEGNSKITKETPLKHRQSKLLVKLQNQEVGSGYSQKGWNYSR